MKLSLFSAGTNNVLQETSPGLSPAKPGSRKRKAKGSKKRRGGLFAGLSREARKAAGPSREARKSGGLSREVR